MVCLMYRPDQFNANVFASAWSPQAWSHGPEDVPERHEWIWCRRHMTTRRRCWRHGVLILPAAPHLFFTLYGWQSWQHALNRLSGYAWAVTMALSIDSADYNREKYRQLMMLDSLSLLHGWTQSKAVRPSMDQRLQSQIHLLLKRLFSIIDVKWKLTKCVTFHWAAVVSRLPQDLTWVNPVFGAVTNRANLWKSLKPLATAVPDGIRAVFTKVPDSSVFGVRCQLKRGRKKNEWMDGCVREDN